MGGLPELVAQGPMGISLDASVRRALVDQGKIQQAIGEILEAIGEDPHREGLRETPRRVAEAYGELFSGVAEDPGAELAAGFETGHEDPVVLKDIPFYSMCEHHLLPFFGRAHVAYIPQGWVVGVSKIARAIDILARRPQLQERLTSQIAELMAQALKPKGVGVVLEAEHLCLTMRGIKKPGSRVVTSALRGLFRDDPAAQGAFYALVQSQRHAP